MTFYEKDSRYFTNEIWYTKVKPVHNMYQFNIFPKSKLQGIINWPKDYVYSTNQGEIIWCFSRLKRAGKIHTTQGRTCVRISGTSKLVKNDH